MNNKNIIFYAEAFPPNRGGGENYSVEFATTLTQLGYKVNVITPVNSNERDQYSFNVTRIQKPIKLLGFNINFLYVIKVLLHHKSYIMHIGGPTIIDPIIISFCKIVRVPVVVTFHGQFNSTLGKLMQKITGKIFYPLANMVIVQSKRDMNLLLGMNKSTKIKLIYFNGVDRNKYKCRINEKINSKSYRYNLFKFIFIGGVSSSRPYKGIENLILIFKKLIDICLINMVSLTIIGDGDLLPKLKAQTRNYQNIVYKGNLNDNELLNELCKSDALILPSISDGEGFGRVVLESISCGKPVFVSKYAGIAELVDRYKAGFVFDPNDIADSVQKISFLVNNRSCLIEYIKNGENMIQHEGLDLISSTAKTIEIYNDIINLNEKS